MKIKPFIFVTLILALSLGALIYYFFLMGSTVHNNEISNKPSLSEDSQRIYIDSQHGFSMYYPKDWKTDLMFDNRNVAIYKDELPAGRRYQMVLNIESNTKKQTAQEMADGPWWHPFHGENIPLGQVVLGENTWAGVTKVFNTEGYDEHLFLVHGENIYHFIYPIGEEIENYVDPVNNYKIARDIIATFSFDE